MIVTRSVTVILTAAYSAVTLASAFAMWTFSRTMSEIAQHGGGIRDLSFGIWQSARFPLSAAWLALVAGGVALVFAILARRRVPQPARTAGSLLPIGFALATAIGAVVLFRVAVAVVVRASFGRMPDPARIWSFIQPALLVAAIVSTLCALITIALTFRSRGGAPFRTAMIVIAISLASSAMLVASLDAQASLWQRINAPQAGDHIPELIERAVPGGR